MKQVIIKTSGNTVRVVSDSISFPEPADRREGTRGSGIIRFREESDWPLKWNA